MSKFLKIKKVLMMILVLLGATMAFCVATTIKEKSILSSNKNQDIAFKMKYHILWDDRTPSKYNSMKKDSVHNLLRHIRNSMAHGNIVSKGKQFELHDYNKNNKITLKGRISMSLFFQLINLLLASSSSKTSFKCPTF